MGVEDFFEKRENVQVFPGKERCLSILSGTFDYCYQTAKKRGYEAQIPIRGGLRLVNPLSDEEWPCATIMHMKDEVWDLKAYNFCPDLTRIKEIHGKK
jgi:hypothetical protein